MKAAVVFFVESDSGADEQDLAAVVKAALFQSGLGKEGFKASIRGQEHEVEIVKVVELGQAAANGYLFTQQTNKAWADKAARHRPYVYEKQAYGRTVVKDKPAPPIGPRQVDLSEVGV